MGFYRQSNGPGGIGQGVSGDGYDGAESLFEQIKTLADELNMPFVPNGSEQAASAKAAVDAYMTARNGTLSPVEAFFHEGKVPNEFPQVGVSGCSQMGGAELDGDKIQNFASEFLNQFDGLLKELSGNPLVFFASILGFLLKLFTEVANHIGRALQEMLRAASALVEDSWKKQLACSSGSLSILQPLDLQLQHATAQPAANL